MATNDLAVSAWVLVGMITGLVAISTILTSVVQHGLRTRQVAVEERVRSLAIMVMTTGEPAAMEALRALVLRHPRGALGVLTRLLWLVRGGWTARLRQALDTPAILHDCRRWVRRPRNALCGPSAEILGLLGHADDLVALQALMQRVRPVAGSAAIGVLRGWPVTDPTVGEVMLRLEELRPDLLRALLPHLDRHAVQEQLATWVKDPVYLPLAVFVAGRLVLSMSAATLLAAMDHPRVQVRRAACVAVHEATHATCRARLAGLAENDAEVLVRVAAVRALGRIPHPDNLPVLRRILDAGPWLVQSHAVAAILAHGEGGAHLLRRAHRGAWRSGAVRWIRELVPEVGTAP